MEYTVKTRSHQLFNKDNDLYYDDCNDHHYYCCYYENTQKSTSYKNSISPTTATSEIIIKIFNFILKLLKKSYYFYLVIFTSITISSASKYNLSSDIDSECSSTSDPKCLKCNVDGCMKCPQLLLIDTRKCIDICPNGYLDQWSTNPDYMGRICLPQANLNNTTYSTLSGIIVGILLCLIFLLLCIILIKRKKRRKTIKNLLISENRIDRYDFLQQLNDIRPNAEYILAMLNDTRRQIRKLHLSGEIQAANSYRPLIRDLAKLLILINRPIELIPAPPHDWNRIYAWAEKALEQYKPQQVGHLIDFFQNNTSNQQQLHHHHHHLHLHHDSTNEILNTTPNDSRFNSLNKHSTFRSIISGLTSNGGTSDGRGCGSSSSYSYGYSGGGTSTSSLSNLKNSHQIQIFGSLISLHEFDEPKSSDPFGSSFNTIKNHHNTTLNNCNNNNSNSNNHINNLINDNTTVNSNLIMTNSELNASSLWLEDEFFKLGLRPQDEITTEL